MKIRVKMSLFFPNWLQERIIALVEKTIDPQVAALQNRVDKLERQEKVASERIDAMDTAITRLLERADEHDRGLSKVMACIDGDRASADAKFNAMSTTANAHTQLIAQHDGAIGALQNSAYDTRMRINGEITDRASAVNKLRLELQDEVRRVNSFFPKAPDAVEQPKAGRVRLNKRTS